jgi:hypothetical protein
VKREEKILLAMFVAVLLGALWMLAFDQRERTADIQFTDATWAADGHFTMSYTITQSDGTLLRQIMSDESDKRILSGGARPASLFRHHFSTTSTGDSYYLVGESAGAHSLLVKTGIIYTVTLTNSLVLYDFTNSHGTHYKREFVLMPYRPQ